MSKQRLIELIDKKSDIFTEANDKIWEYAEVRFSLPKSADLFCSILKNEGFTIERGVADMQDAFVATFSNGNAKPVVGILAEYDALYNLSQVSDSDHKEVLVADGNGHGCGHHALGAGSLAGAVGIKDYILENNLNATIKFFGCPAEESGSGKAYMARSGLFYDLDAIFTWHPGADTRAGSISTLANYQVYFNFKGISSHAAAAPHLGRSALDAVELMSVGVNYLREHIIDEARMHYAVTDSGGHSPNVVQPNAEVLYFIRAPKSSQVKEIFERVVDIAKGAALMTGTQMSIKWDSACSEIIVNDVLGKVMSENLKELGSVQIDDSDIEYAQKYFDHLNEFEKNSLKSNVEMFFGPMGEEKVKELLNKPILNDIFPYFLSEKAMPGSSDVGDASFCSPTAQMQDVCFPSGTVAHSWQWVATGKSDLCHKGLIHAGKVIAMSVLDIITDPAIAEKAKIEFDQRLKGEAYDCAIPKDVKPTV